MTLAVVSPNDAAPPALLDEAAKILAGRTIAFLTGAGMSTDSGIPDYRGEGAPKRSPMNVTQFLTDPEFRKRYWAGSHRGWTMFDAAQPNDGHRVMAEFETSGHSNGVVTQNVDGLHLKAGSRRVVDLHGSMDRVRCVDCGQFYARTDISARMTADNPWIVEPDSVSLNPDGDAQVSGVERFIVPSCTVCGGVLKPDVVFFGEFIPTGKFQKAKDLIERSDALVVAGSSLVVNSGIRLVEIARRIALPIIVVNRGATKGDARATLKLDAGTTQTLDALADRLIR